MARVVCFAIIFMISLVGVRVAGAIAETKLAASDGAASDEFGADASLRGDIAVVGAPGDNNFMGSAYVFVRNGTSWSQQAKFNASDGEAYDFFGSAVSLSGDTVIVGAPGYYGPGAAYVFVRNGTSWSQQAEFNASDGGDSDGFGGSVSLDGDTALVAAPGINNYTGAAYVFVRNGTTWSLQAELTASDGAPGDGCCVVSVNGNTVLVGVADAKNVTGSAYVFVRNGAAWSQQAKLMASDGAENDLFGLRVSLDRDTALVGAAGHDTRTGAEYVFVRNGTTWSQQAELKASDGATYDEFGWGVSLEGDTAVIGAPGVDYYTGAAYLFVRNGTAWSQQAKLTASDGASGDTFGAWGVSVSGGLALISTPNANGRVPDSGAAYLYQFGPTAPSAPGGLEATPDIARIILNWQAPQSDGGSPITNYRIYRGTDPGGESLLAEIGNVLTYTDAAVSSNVTYYYQVTAVNAVGESPESNEASAAPATRPSAPQNLSGIPGDGQVALFWHAPVSDGGWPITNYTIYRGTSAGGESRLATVDSALSYTDSGLTNGVTYFYQVGAVNGIGEGPRSNEISAAPALLPTAPLMLTAAPGEGKVTISWQAPSSNGGSPITNYSIYRGTSAGGESLVASIGDVLTYADSALTIGETYFYQVSATNTIGEGPKSNEASAKPDLTPSAPLMRPPSPENGQVTLSWYAAASAGGSPILNYTIYRGTSSGGESILTTIGNVRSYTNTGLTNGEIYYYRVSAVNAVGEGPQSDEVSAMPTAPPDTIKPTVAITSPPSGATVTSATLTVTGTASDDIGVARVEVSTDGTNWIAATGTTSWSATVTLRGGLNTVYVRAMDEAGNSATKTIAITLQTPVATGGLPPLLVGVGILVGAIVVAAVAFARLRRRAGRKGQV